MSSVLLPPVSERVRVSARVPAGIAQRIDTELSRRHDLGEIGGRSLAELVSLAVTQFAMLELEQMYRAHRRIGPMLSAPAAMHLQPRIAPDLAEFLELAPTLLQRRFHERHASRRSVIIAALDHTLPRQGNIKATSGGEVAATNRRTPATASEQPFWPG